VDSTIDEIMPEELAGFGSVHIGGSLGISKEYRRRVWLTIGKTDVAGDAIRKNFSS